MKMVESKDYPVCPYCGDKYEDYYELEEGNNTIKCWVCGEKYLCKVENFSFENNGEREYEIRYETSELLDLNLSHG